VGALFAAAPRHHIRRCLRQIGRYAYIYIYIYTCVCMLVREYIYIYINIYTYIHNVYVDLSITIPKHVYGIYVCMYVCMHT
jgi:hypothetical protein